MDEIKALQEDTPSNYSDTTTLMHHTQPPRFEPIRGTSDNEDVDLEHFTATGQPYATPTRRLACTCKPNPGAIR